MSTLDFMLMVALGITTYGLRAVFLLLKKPIPLNPYLASVLDHIPTASLCALVVPMVWVVDGQLSIQPERTIAFVLAIIASFYVRSFYTTIVVGLGTLWFLKFVL